MHDAGLYARSFADVYDMWYSSLDDPAHLVAAVSSRCRPGAMIVELGSGTGRLATPLHRSGFHVIAIDVAPSMLELAPGGPERIGADMTELPLHSTSVELVIVAYNTLFNLTSRGSQQRCFAEAARILRPDALFAVEAFISPASHAEYGITIKSHPTDESRRLAIVTGPSATDSDVIDGSHVELGRTTTCRPWQLVYQSPAELDVLAAASGFELAHRHADWAGSVFDEDGQRHVSWYKRI